MVISHSHPLNHEDEKSTENHEHTESEICFYSSFNFDYYDVAPELQINNCDYSVPNNYACQFVSIPKSAYYFHKKLRGPPAFQIS